ncbi:MULTISPECIES: metal ABC transporter solute-binding protein, Zn/Mn family [unclassified Marinitoga]|uniref:metal ABC transporter solute-binding protein, Zn/Mn family n=1 Tax=unclassified Marinitoga TaxID=2640159 RepID=UPI0006410CB8|nr:MULTISPECIES: zinc ABC transporter substrate-binding protein [unclassified Marinitoga]KLO25185.1 hypothetical protein X274_01135 [Marinitoga sp. 1155]NUU98589.1 hypothetical protein [Marinitoga sp. 1154]
MKNLNIFFTILIILIINSRFFALNILTSIKPLELIVREISPEANIINLFNSSEDFKNATFDENIYSNMDLIILLNNEISFKNDSNKIVLSEGVLYYPYQKNPFLWSDPLYTVVIAYKIEKKMESLDPKNAIKYRDNLLRFTQKLVELSDYVSKIAKDSKIKIIDMNNLLIHFYNRYNINYYLYSDDITITRQDVLISSIKYNNSTFNNLKNKKISIDIFLSGYNTIIEFYKNIIDEIFDDE